MNLPFIRTLGFWGPPDLCPLPLTFSFTHFHKVVTGTCLCFTISDMFTFFLSPCASANL